MAVLLFFAFCFVFLHVVEHVLHVFVVFEFLEELLDLLALFGCNFLQVVRDAHKFGALDFESVFFEVFLDA